ncbi:MAG: hypothetical protein GY786_11320 [Proteobacteria bacterium]|nr:hypothetical protein [Pseudomonadota bacterium]
MSSCLTRKASASKDTKVVKRVCADKRLNLAFDHHLRAKEFLSSFYKTRKESELFFAWYASEDSTHMAKSITNCFDRQNKHFYAVKNISKKNRVLKGLIVQNMRLDSQARVSELFLDEYQKIFVRDIQ